MKSSQQSLLLRTVIGGSMLLTPLAFGQTVTVLESFEGGVDSVTLVGGDTRPVASIAVDQYTATAPSDPAVTDGTKALQVTLKDNLGWNRDADITLTDEASALVRQAWASKQEARYLIRYDVQFNNEAVGWGNFVTWLNGTAYGQLELGSGINNAFTLPLDVIETDLAGEGPVVLNVVNQYDTGGGAVEKAVIVDNIRLIDTYAPGAVPEVILLNGFETAEDVAKVVSESTRVTLSLHQKTGADDIAVTEGSGSLAVAFSGPGDWIRDITIPFRGTVMEAIARVPQEDRWRYTLRMDVVYSDAGAWANGNWQNLVMRQADGGAQPITLFRRVNAQHARTLNMTLDNFLLTPSDPANPDDLNPGISITNQGAWADGDNPVMYIDNIRLIDTGKAPLRIRDLTRNAEGGVDIQWDSSSAQSYGISVSNDLENWSDLVTGVLGTSDGTLTTYTASADAVEGRQFYRIYVSGAAPPLNEGFENGLGEWKSVVKDGHEGNTTWEAGVPTNGPGAAHGGTNAAGTGLAADYESKTHIALQSPVANLAPFITPPTLSFAYYLDSDETASAGRVNVLDANGVLIEEGTPDNGLFFVGTTEGWQEVSLPMPVTGQKVILEFEFVDGGGSLGAGFFIDDVLLKGDD